MGPTVSQMFQHPAAHAAGRVAAATSFPWGLVLWLLVLAGLAAAYGALRAQRTRRGPRLTVRAGDAVARGTDRRSFPWGTWQTAAADAARAVRDRALGLGRFEGTASGSLWRRMGLGQEGSLRVESRVQLAPGRWLVRVDTGEERLLFTVGADVHVIATEPRPAPVSAAQARSPEAEPEAEPGRTAPQPYAASEFARILGASLSRLGEEHGEGRS